MTVSPEELASLVRRRFAIVQEIQRLNARYLRTQQLSGGFDFALMMDDDGETADDEAARDEAADDGAANRAAANQAAAERRAERAALLARAAEAEAERAACEAEIAAWQERLDEIDRLIGEA